LKLIHENLIIPGVWLFLSRGHNLNKLGKGPLVILHAKYQMYVTYSFREEDILTKCWRTHGRIDDGQTGITEAHIGTLCQSS